jgi:hypothetical protein
MKRLLTVPQKPDPSRRSLILGQLSCKSALAPILQKFDLRRRRPLTLPSIMKLIDYSDSEGSGSEENEPTSPPPAPKPHHATLPKKAKKIIMVDLPKPSKPDDDDDDEPARKRVRTDGGGGLFSMLPPPKRSKPSTNASVQKEVFVKLDEPEGSNETETVVKETAATTTFMPRSAQQKKGKATAKPIEKPKPSISLFPLGPELTTKPTPQAPSNPSTYQPLIAQPIPEPAYDDYVEEPSFVPDTTAPLPKHMSTADLDTFAAHILEGRHRKNRTIEIMDYDAGEVYAQNAADKIAGVLQEQIAPVRAIGSGRHQLSQLLNNVQDQRESLEEAFAKGRRVKKESGAKYGW